MKTSEQLTKDFEKQLMKLLKKTLPKFLAVEFAGTKNKKANVKKTMSLLFSKTSVKKDKVSKSRGRPKKVKEVEPVQDYVDDDLDTFGEDE